MRILRIVAAIASRAFGWPVSIIAGYLGTLTVAAWSARRTTMPSTSAPRTRFDVLIPAHNEEQLIGQTIDSLKAVDYPPDLLAVHVVADHCTDRTAEIASSRDVNVHERHDPERPGKGASLQWLFELLEREGADRDAVAFIDADTIVSGNFLRVADELLTGGAHVVQCHYAVRDDTSSPLVAFRAAAMAARNFLRPLGRTRIGATAGLFGNGMVIRADVLRMVRWTNHLTEDAELQLLLLERGIKVAFAPGARVEAEMPDTLDAARTQHARWERGRIELARRFVPRLLREALVGGRAGRIANVDAALDLLVPPFSVVVGANVVWSAAAFGQWALAPTARHRRTLALSAAAAAVHAVYVLSALRMVGAPAQVYRSLLRAPRLVLWKLGLWLRALVRPSGIGWIRTSRNVGSPDDAAGSAAQ